MFYLNAPPLISMRFNMTLLIANQQQLEAITVIGLNYL